MPANTSEFLATVPLFAALEPAEVARFAEVTREKVFPKGAVILQENDTSACSFTNSGTSLFAKLVVRSINTQ